jgi:hypothetical protein
MKDAPLFIEINCALQSPKNAGDPALFVKRRYGDLDAVEGPRINAFATWC